MMRFLAVTISLETAALVHLDDLLFSGRAARAPLPLARMPAVDAGWDDSGFIRLRRTFLMATPHIRGTRAPACRF